MKFCQQTLFESGRAEFIKNSIIYLRKISGVLMVKAVLDLISSLADNIVQLAILCIYMRRIGYDSAIVNSFFSWRMNSHILFSSPTISCCHLFLRFLQG